MFLSGKRGNILFSSVDIMSKSKAPTFAEDKEDGTDFVLLRLTRSEAKEVLKLIKKIRKREDRQ
jgi:hypothetical protein